MEIIDGNTIGLTGVWIVDLSPDGVVFSDCHEYFEGKFAKEKAHMFYEKINEDWEIDEALEYVDEIAEKSEYPHIVTKLDYDRYVGAVKRYFDETGLCNLSPIVDDDGNWADNYFSWKGCDVCGRTLGGDRYECNGWSSKHDEVIDEIGVCIDCIYFAEYGRLDDSTMMIIENNS